MNVPATHFVAGTDRSGGVLYYTGRTGDSFVSQNRTDAFVGWYESGAERVAERLNRMSLVHGITFRAVAA